MPRSRSRKVVPLVKSCQDHTFCRGASQLRCCRIERRRRCRRRRPPGATVAAAAAAAAVAIAAAAAATSAVAAAACRCIAPTVQGCVRKGRGSAGRRQVGAGSGCRAQARRLHQPHQAQCVANTWEKQTPASIGCDLPGVLAEGLQRCVRAAPGIHCLAGPAATARGHAAFASGPALRCCLEAADSSATLSASRAHAGPQCRRATLPGPEALPMLGGSGPRFWVQPLYCLV